MGFTNCCAYLLAAACPYVMGALICDGPATGAKCYVWAWMYVACAVGGGVIAALCLVDHKPSESSDRPPPASPGQGA